MLTKCKTCEGNGYVVDEKLGFAVECDVCHGKGGFNVPENKELCPRCSGTGTVIARVSFGGPTINIECDCKNCFGTGFINKK